MQQPPNYPNDGSWQQPQQPQYPQQPNTYYPPEQWQQPPMMPPPPPPRPPRKRPSPLIIIGIVIGAIILFSALGRAISQSSPSRSTSTLVATTATPTATDTPFPTSTTASSSALHFNVGQAASTPDGYIVTVSKTYTSAGGEFNTPSQGNQYLVVDVSVKNNTGQVQHMASIQFTLTDSTGQTIDDTIASLPNVHPFVGGTLQDGTTMRGQLVYEVPTGKHPYSLAFAANSFSDNQTIWDITT